MEKDLGHYRKSYEQGSLDESQLDDNPMGLFHRWFHQADEHPGAQETNAMSLSTIGQDGFPKTRVVLLKKFDEYGFVFYTNYLSEKGLALAHNPKVCLSFHWHALERQVIIKGVAQKIDPNTSDVYFDSRPLGSRLGAMVSPQSQVISSRDVLEKELAELEKKYTHQEPKRPYHWGGYLVTPHELEFWQGRPNRLHDRIRYRLVEEIDWVYERLAP
ncbi:MAG: pyridoxamine 5'-phosphate oxidase [Flavobacteriaceae bacterium]